MNQPPSATSSEKMAASVSCIAQKMNAPDQQTISRFRYQMFGSALLTSGGIL